MAESNPSAAHATPTSVDPADIPAADLMADLANPATWRVYTEDWDPAYGNPATFDVLKSLQGRTISIIVTKTW